LNAEKNKVNRKDSRKRQILYCAQKQENVIVLRENMVEGKM
jgi:hypothetical protein